jgi:hypothetical protein
LKGKTTRTRQKKQQINNNTNQKKLKRKLNKIQKLKLNLGHKIQQNKNSVCIK